MKCLCFSVTITQINNTYPTISGGAIDEYSDCNTANHIVGWTVFTLSVISITFRDLRVYNHKAAPATRTIRIAFAFVFLCVMCSYFRFTSNPQSCVIYKLNAIITNIILYIFIFFSVTKSRDMQTKCFLPPSEIV